MEGAADGFVKLGSATLRPESVDGGNELRAC